MESPRELAAKIADHQAYVDADAVTVANAYLELTEAAHNFRRLFGIPPREGFVGFFGAEPVAYPHAAITRLDDALRAAEEPAADEATEQLFKDFADGNLSATPWRGVYPGMCRDPEICRGRTSCPRNPSCSE